MKESNFKTLVQQTYNSASPLPYIITVPVVLFLIFHIVGILSPQTDSFLISQLSLSPLVKNWIYQPWSFLTHPLVYTGFLSLAFDCLWLYWTGNIFLNLLSKRYFYFVFFGGILIGALAFLLFNIIPLLGKESQAWTSFTFGLTSILAGLTILSPKAEVRLLLFGNVNLKTISFLYVLIQTAILLYNQQYPAAIGVLAAIAYAILFIRALSNGNDWSFRRPKKKHLKVVHRQDSSLRYSKNDIPNQQIIDQVLDKISASGYNSLSAEEKEILFKASKNN